jgi:hypothetical protein
MICNQRAGGLTLIAIFVLSGVIASAASAQSNGTLTSDGPVTLHSALTGEGHLNALTVLGTRTECPKAIYTGHKYNETPHGFISSGESKITITPDYGPCSVAGLRTTLDMNGCDYVLDLEGTTSEDEYATKTTVVCPLGNHIEMTLFTSEVKHAEGKPFCTITFTENAAGYAGLFATDTVNGYFDVRGTTEAIVADQAGGGILCPATTTGVAIDIDMTFEGLNESGQATGISLSHH